jgi:hypothetical protein
MKLAISQPTYLPWLGYFDLIDEVDRFVLLDSVQFERQSWQQRNRIKTPTGLQWLTVPVMFRGRLGQSIQEVEIREPEFWRNHRRSIELNYRRTPYFDTYFSPLVELLEKGFRGGLLVELNICLIEWFCRELGICTPLSRSSEMNREGNRTTYLVNLCQVLGSDQYLSPLGSADYLLDDLQQFSDAGIEVTFHNYHPVPYRQLFPPFVPYASILDLLFNEGPEALTIIRKGRRTPRCPSQVASTLQST